MSDESGIQITAQVESIDKAVDAINKISKALEGLKKNIPSLTGLNKALNGLPAGIEKRYNALANSIGNLADKLSKINGNGLKDVVAISQKIGDTTKSIQALSKNTKKAANAVAVKESTDFDKLISDMVARQKAEMEGVEKFTEAEEKKAKLLAEKLRIRKPNVPELWEKQTTLDDKIFNITENFSKPKIDKTKYYPVLEDLKKEIDGLIPHLDNVSNTAITRFQSISEKLRQSTIAVEEQKQALESMTRDMEFLEKTFKGKNPLDVSIYAPDTKELETYKTKIKDAQEEIKKSEQNVNLLRKALYKVAGASETVGKRMGNMARYSAKGIEDAIQKSKLLRSVLGKLHIPINKAASAMANFGNKARQALSGAFGKIKNMAMGIGSKFTGLFKGANFGNFFSSPKLFYAVRGIRMIASAFQHALESSAELQQNMNLFNISMGENVKPASQFVENMSKAFSMDKSELLRTMGTFYQISHSMGVTSKNAYVLSENFTKLANDLSSFYNISINDAVVKLQAGLVGETEPLRRLGIIITENALKQTAMNLGIEKSVKEMSEAEKMHLRYITVLQQTKNIHGDFARTIDHPAQAFRILKEQMTQFTRALGSVFMPLISTVMPYITAFARAITTVTNALARMVGFKPPEFKKFSIDANHAVKSVGAIGNKMANSFDKAKDHAKELQRFVMKFDELNIIKPHEKSSKAGKNAENAGGFAAPDLMGYDNMMDQVKSKTDEIYDKIMEKFKGIGKAFEPTIEACKRLWKELERLGEFTWQGLKDFYNHFLVPVGKWTLGEGIPRLVNALTNGLAKVNWQNINNALKNLWDALTPFAITIGDGLVKLWEKAIVPLGTATLNNAVPTFLNLVSGALTLIEPGIESCVDTLVELFEDFLEPCKNFLDGGVCNFLSDLAKKAPKAAEALEKIKPATSALNQGFLATIFPGLSIIPTIQVLKSLNTDFSACTESVMRVGNTYKDYFSTKQTPDKKSEKEIPFNFNDTWSNLARDSNTAWENFKKTFGNALSKTELSKSGKSFLEQDFDDDVVIWENIEKNSNIAWENIKKTWNTASQKLGKNAENIKTSFATTWDTAKTKSQTCWDKTNESATNSKNTVTTKWNDATTWLDKKANEIKNSFKSAWSTTQTKASECKSNVQRAWENLPGKMNAMWETVKKNSKTCWSNIQATFKPVGDWFGSKFETAKTKVSEKMGGIQWVIENAWKKVKEKFSNIGTNMGNAIGGTFKSVINGALKSIEDKVNGFIRTINGITKNINFFGRTIPQIPEVKIPRMASGGLVTQSRIVNVGEGSDDEAILPLNERVFAALAKGINRYNENTSPFDEEILYRAFSRALREQPDKNATFIARLDSRIIAQEVLRKQESQNMRFDPVSVA